MNVTESYFLKALSNYPKDIEKVIENLNQLQSDIIFIKNIDNVSQNNREVILTYKKLLGGILLYTKQEVDAALKKFQKK